MRFICCCVLLLVPGLVQAQLKIETPRNDTLVVHNPLLVEGVAPNGAAAVEVTVIGNQQVNQQVKVVNGKWQATFKGITQGTHIIQVEHQKEVDRVLVVVVSTLAKRNRQKVCFVWDSGVDGHLESIAAGTLDTLSGDKTVRATQVAGFVEGVKQRTVALFLAAYDGLGIEFEPAPGPDVHAIRMLAKSGSIFGQSPYDCGNSTAAEESEVWVGTYRDTIVDDFDHPIIGWQPMKKGDDLQTRLEDVAQALGRTAAHELGHSLGMVGSGGTCKWMKGCDGGHNCDQFDLDNAPFSARFDSGRFIMDPGNKTENTARLAESLRTDRTMPRQSAVFNRFNRSYLNVIQP